MKYSIPEISWHNRDPVLSVDFQPKQTQDEPLRVATGGADSHVLVCTIKFSTIHPQEPCCRPKGSHRKTYLSYLHIYLSHINTSKTNINILGFKEYKIDKWEQKLFVLYFPI